MSSKAEQSTTAPSINAPSADTIREKERKILKGYGGLHRFMMSYGLKPFEMDDEEEARAILNAMAVGDAEEEMAQDGGGK